MTHLSRQQIAWRLAQDIPEGACVNPGSGMPLMVSDYVPDGREVVFHAENGLLGIGPRQTDPVKDMNLINAGTEVELLVSPALALLKAPSPT